MHSNYLAFVEKTQHEFASKSTNRANLSKDVEVTKVNVIYNPAAANTLNRNIVDTDIRNGLYADSGYTDLRQSPKSQIYNVPPNELTNTTAQDKPGVQLQTP